MPEIEFSIYDDGRLDIIDGDEILVLPPDATRRLAASSVTSKRWPPDNRIKENERCKQPKTS